MMKLFLEEHHQVLKHTDCYARFEVYLFFGLENISVLVFIEMKFRFVLLDQE